MEREILFRGKDELTKEWRYGYLLSKNVIGEVIFENGTYTVKCTTVIPETVGQFIDYEDNEGVKTFEGDNVFFKYAGKIREGTVIFCDKTNAFVVAVKNSMVKVSFQIIDSLLIIGTIHE